MKIRTLLASTILYVSGVANCNSAVISADLKQIGDGLISLDTSTQLEWLDLSYTSNRTRIQILDDLAQGGSLEGWRYATTSEVIGLWGNFDIDLSMSSIGYQTGLDNNIVTAADMLGNTRCMYDCDKFPYGTLGLTNTSHDNVNYDLLGAYYTNSDYTYYWSEGEASRLADQAAIYFGHYLIRDAETPSPVPLPGALVLFISGVVSLFALKRKRL